MAAAGGGSESEALRALRDVLARRPDTIVIGLGPDGRPAALPHGLCGEGPAQRPFGGLEAVAPADQVRVARAWAEAHHRPIVEADVHLADAPDVVVPLLFLNLRPDHDVIAVVVDADAEVVEEATSPDHARKPAPGLVGVARRDATGVFLDIDPVVTKLLGWLPAQVVGRSALELVHPDDAERAIAGWLAMRAGAEGGGRMQVRYRHADGGYRWIEATNESRLDEAEDPCVVSRFVDITDQMAALDALRERERQLERLAAALPVGVCHVRPDGTVAYANPPFAGMLGAVSSIDELVDGVEPAARSALRAALQGAMAGQGCDVEVEVDRGIESHRYQMSVRPLADDEPTTAPGVIICCSDVTDRVRLQHELEHRASHDALSGCLNRAASVAELERALRDHPSVTVAYIDLDRFKAVNDALGHAAGDELLRVTAARLRSVVRAKDRVGRIGGDEFVVICPQGQERLPADVLVQRLGAALDGEVSFARERILLKASIGAISADRGTSNATEVLAKADEAMYSAKRAKQASALRVLPGVSA